MVYWEVVCGRWGFDWGWFEADGILIGGGLRQMGYWEVV